MFTHTAQISRPIAAPIAEIAGGPLPARPHTDELKTGAFIARKLVRDLCQMADDVEAAYALTNFADTFLRCARDREVCLTEAEAHRVLGAIALASVLVAERMPIDPVTAAEGMEAAARIVHRRWIEGDQPGSRAPGRWPLQARLKILRNASHSIALRRELAEPAKSTATVA